MSRLLDETPIHKRIILDLCAGTGAWSQPYLEAGYDVRRVTLPEQDVSTYCPPEQYWGVLAAPPCTEFAVSGARWWAQKPSYLLSDALRVVEVCLQIASRAEAWWALENPVGRLRHYIGPPVMYFDPCDYGDPWTKRTCLWGRFTAPKQSPVHATEFWGWHKLGGKSERTKRLRSITPPGFARAFFEANP